MSPRLDRRTTENRDPHTVYLTPETWDALEHAYLEQRMADASRISKIEFIEDLIRRGLPRAKPRPRAMVAPPAAPMPASTSSPAGSGGSPIAEPAPVRRQRPTTEVTRRPRRNSALERLIQASDPGRPAPIDSAAGREIVEDAPPE
jgi:hypothetical protein